MLIQITRKGITRKDVQETVSQDKIEGKIVAKGADDRVYFSFFSTDKRIEFSRPDLRVSAQSECFAANDKVKWFKRSVSIYA